MKKTLLALCIWIAFQPLLWAQQPYFADVLSIFGTYNCTGCHGASSGLSVGTYNSLLAGGNNCGPAILPFNANGSPLVTKIDPSIPNCSGGNMPQGGGTVSAAHLATIKQWIEGGALQNASSDCADLTISAYVEGSNDNKYLEIYNGTGAERNLSGYSIRMYNNGSSSPVATIPLSGILAADGYFLIGNDDASLPGLTPDIVAASLNFNGNDAVALYNGTTNIDVFGQIGFNPGDDGWANGTCTTKDHTWIKIDNGTSCKYGNFLGSTEFSTPLGTLYTCYPQNEVSQLNSFEPSTAACPTITFAAGTTNPSIACSGSSLDLSVVLGDDTTAQVLWYESGTIIGSGTTLNAILQNNSCISQTFNLTAVASNANPTCTPASISLVLNLLPLPDDGASVINNGCEVCLLTSCVDMTSYSVNGSAAVEGLCYTASSNENSNVVFTIANQCGTQTYTGDVSCGGDPQNAQISGFVWLDGNDDLQYNAGEIRLNGVEVGLFDASASLLISTETDFNGNYAFSGLPAGSYFLAFSAPGIIGHPIVGAGTNGLTAPFDLSISQNYELNVGYIIDLSTDNINGTTSPLVLAQVAPQPASDWLQIDFYSQYTEPTLLQIYNLHGSLLYQSTVAAQSGYGNSTRLDLANYSSGMYILLLQNRYAQLTQKITKL